MYKILVDGKLFSSSKIEELAILNPTIKLVANTAGTFEFTMPPNHPYYDLIVRKMSLIDIYRDDDTEPLFEGICVSIEDDFFKQRKIICEGDLTFLNDSMLRPSHKVGLTSRQLLEAYINEHNSIVEAQKRFTVGQVTAKDTNDYITCFTNYQTTMTEIKEDLVDDIGGYLRTRHVNGVRYLDYLAESPRTNNQVIRLGENLLDISIGLDTDDIATVIIPLGVTLETQSIEGLDERLTIKTATADSMHPSNKDYVYSADAVEHFGWIEKVVEWDDVSVADILKAKAEKYLQETQFENLVIEAKAIDLGLTSDEFQKFRLLDKIRVVSRPHGLDKYFMLTEMEIHLNNPESDTITLGSKQAHSLSATTASANVEVLKRIEQMPTSNAVKSAINNATSLITGSEGGYVVIERNNDGQPIEIKIQDALNNPTKVWRWNQNGFGYSNDGGKTYGTAITMDGSIIADYITSGTMTGDRIRGGTFEIGGTSLGKDGKILVKNAQGQTLITIDKNGITFSGGETIDYSHISGVPKSIVWEHTLYYKATTNDWPTAPSAEITTSATDLSDTWSMGKPTYDDMVRCFTCTQYKLTDGTVRNTAIEEYVTKWFSTKITKDTITTAYINALNVTAKYINSVELRNTGVAKVAGWNITDNAIVSYDNTTYENSLKYTVMRKYTGDDNAVAIGIFKRASTNVPYTCVLAFRWDGALISADALNIYTNNATYGLWVHGKEYVDGDINLTGGIFSNLNIYSERNVSGAVVDGRTGLNATQGGIYGGRDLYVEGSIGCGGTKHRIVKTDNYGYRGLNAYETTTPYFGDIGEGVLNADGECIIYLDDILYECIDTDSNYQVFLQKYGQGDIWVDARENNYFIVKGTPNMKFGWELKAIQRNYDSIRLDMPNDAMTRAIIDQYAED